MRQVTRDSLHNKGMASRSLANVNVYYLLSSAPVSIVRRGSAYHQEGRARILLAIQNYAVVEVEGSYDRVYEVTVTLHSEGADFLTFTCDCPYSYERPEEWCKHKVAAILEIHDHFKAAYKPSWRDVLDETIKASPLLGRARPQALAFSIQSNPPDFDIVPYSIPCDDLAEEYRGDCEQVAALIERGGAERGANQILSLPAGGLAGIVAEAAHISAVRILLDERRRWVTTDRSLTAALPLLASSLVYRGTFGAPFQQRLRVSERMAETALEIREEDGELKLAPHITINGTAVPLRRDTIDFLCSNPVWVRAGDTIAQVDCYEATLSVLLRQNDLVIPESEQDAFVEDYLAPLAARVRVTGAGAWEWHDVRARPVGRIYLSETQQTFTAELRFAYDGMECPFDPAYPALSYRRDSQKGVFRVHRSGADEQAAWKALSSHGLKRAQPPGHFALRQAVSPAEFLIHHIPGIAAAGYEVYGEDNLRSVRVNRSRPSISFSVASGIDWFDLHAEISFGDTSASLKALRKAVRRRERYVKLMDGSIGEIPPEWLEKYRHLFDAGTETGEGLRLTNAQAMILERIVEEEDQARLDAELQARLAKLRGFSAIEPKPPPDGFTGEMRHYQKHGYDWLHFLREYRFGGCLADDMGLGKTIQALAFVQSLRETEPEHQPSLVVVRRSLLTNWQREAARFAPGLRVLQHTEGDRQRDPRAFDDYDLVLTTYGVMRRDVEMLKSRVFRCIILDESQAIKNPQSLTARAARRLQGLQRISLTGTPVENSTVELWSQFAFLNPGMLGSLDYFRREFAAPIERKNHEPTAEYLRSLVHPFILRRTKEQVAPELPARTERIVFCDLDEHQRRLYDQYREHYRGMLIGLIEEKGMDGARMRILEGLLRLRQISIHPLLVESGYKGESAKMDVLLETLETLRSEGHKALVFSQFVQMLRLVQKALKELGIPHQYLDGQTKNRQERIDEFQADADIPFFLISLKAGGVGLNLTAADYVIHLDPWWNPAVERQASDRTHRIGQDKPVFVHKLIARDTVEEKMLDLQERKRALVDRLVSTESGFFKSLTHSDVQALFS